MNKHDFTKFYKIGGPLIEDHMKKILANENSHYKINEQIKPCITYLKELSDDNFIKLYNDMHWLTIDYQQDSNKTDLYACAFLSDVELLGKCLLISRALIFRAVNIIMNNINYGIGIINIECCKLLRTYGFDFLDLLAIAYKTYDYDTIRYIINNLTEMELIKLIYDSDNVRYGLFNILIIDKIFNMPDDYFKII
jgi:hypothetical protein